MQGRVPQLDLTNNVGAIGPFTETMGLAALRPERRDDVGRLRSKIRNRRGSRSRL